MEGILPRWDTPEFDADLIDVRINFLIGLIIVEDPAGGDVLRSNGTLILQLVRDMVKCKHLPPPEDDKELLQSLGHVIRFTTHLMNMSDRGVLMPVPDSKEDPDVVRLIETVRNPDLSSTGGQTDPLALETALSRKDNLDFWVSLVQDCTCPFKMITP